MFSPDEGNYKTTALFQKKRLMFRYSKTGLAICLVNSHCKVHLLESDIEVTFHRICWDSINEYLSLI